MPMMQCLPASLSAVPPIVKPRLLRHLLLIALLLLSVLACGYAGYRLSEQAGIRTSLTSKKFLAKASFI